MSRDDLRFTRELDRLDPSKLDRAERREVEGLYRTKEYLAGELQRRLGEVTGERDSLRTRVDRLQAERDALRDRVSALETDRGTVAPDRVVASIGDALASAREELADADYAVGRVEVDLKANVRGDADGIALQLPDLAEPIASETLSTFRFGLRPAARREESTAYEPIPDVRDRPVAAARESVARAGFTVGEVTTEPGDTDGVVVDQFPSPRSVAEPGTAIDLTVSERRDVEVPGTVGHDLDDAVRTLEGAALAVGEVDAETREDPADLVVAQSPAAGEAVPVGTRVDLTVSAGPPGRDTSDERQDAARPEETAEAKADQTDETDAETGRTDEVDARSKRTDEVGADRPDLQAVDGIGPTYADRLRAAGVADLPTLLDQDPADVAAITRASPGRVEDWFDRAERLLEGA